MKPFWFQQLLSRGIFIHTPRKKPQKNKSQITNCKILDWQSNMKNVLKQKHQVFFTTPFLITVTVKKACVFSTRGHTSCQIYLPSHRKKLKIVMPAVKRDKKNVITQTHLRCYSWKLVSEVRMETLSISFLCYSAVKACMKVLTKTAIDETTVATLSSTKIQINKPQHWRIQGVCLSGLQPPLWEVF